MSSPFSLGQPVFENECWSVMRLRSEAIIVVRRSGVPFTSAVHCDEMAEPVQEELDRLGRGSHGLLIDSRDAPRRNDPAYESWFAKHRVKMIIGFPRVAVLVKSMAGLLQTQRLSTDGGLTNVNPHVRSFNHEADAWAYARGET